jgi:hypothetical protein
MTHHIIIAPELPERQADELTPSAWSDFGDGSHDYALTGKHDPLHCRACQRERIARLERPCHNCECLLVACYDFKRDGIGACCLHCDHRSLR